MHKNFTKITNKFIRGEIEHIVNDIRDILGANCVSIYLIGSAARNELSILEDNEVFDVLSDYEFVLVVKNKRGVPLAYLNDFLNRKYVVNSGRSNLFKIDLGIVPVYKLPLIPPSLWSFEFLQCGILLYGDEVRKSVRSVTARNIDRGNLRWLIAIRLWNYLKNTQSPGSSSSTAINRLLLARNLLEIPSIVLPHFDLLFAGYTARADEMTNLPPNVLYKLGGINLYDSALQIKLHPNQYLQYPDVHVVALFDSYTQLLKLLSSQKLYLNHSTTQIDLATLQRQRFFAMSTQKEIRMMANNLGYFLLLYKELSFSSAVKWLIRPTRYKFCMFLIAVYKLMVCENSLTNNYWVEVATVNLSDAIGRKVQLAEGLSDDEKIMILTQHAKIFMKRWYEGKR